MGSICVCTVAAILHEPPENLPLKAWTLLSPKYDVQSQEMNRAFTYCVIVVSCICLFHLNILVFGILIIFNISSICVQCVIVDNMFFVLVFLDMV